MGEAWFRPKTYGFGAYPASWKGWAAVSAYLLALVLLSLALLGPSLWGGAPLSLARVALLLGGALVGTLAFIGLCVKKSSGPWRWRWGRD